MTENDRQHGHAIALRAALGAQPATSLSGTETALLRDWLDRLAAQR